MLIRLTRLTNERHRLEFVRDDGTSEARELETRSALLHDLVHYAVETEAGLEASFYGQLAGGKTYEALTAEPSDDPEAMGLGLEAVEFHRPELPRERKRQLRAQTIREIRRRRKNT